MRRITSDFVWLGNETRGFRRSSTRAWPGFEKRMHLGTTTTTMLSPKQLGVSLIMALGMGSCMRIGLQHSRCLVHPLAASFPFVNLER